MDKPTNPWAIHRSLRLRRDVLPNIVLQRLARDSLSLAEASEGREQRYWCVAAITFAALAVESFLNVVGKARVGIWDYIEKTTSPADKLAILENVLKFKADRSDVPFNGFKDLFTFRNLIVHAKPDSLPIKLTPVTGHPIPWSKGQMPLAKWEKIATLRNARLLVTRSDKIIDFLAKQAKIQLPTDDHAVTKAWLEKPRPK